MQTHSASGVLSESGLLKISTDLGNVKAKRYTFNYWEEEDIRQEIAISVIKSSPKFDPKHKDAKTPMKFFNMTSENALKNLQRDNKIADKVNDLDIISQTVDNSFENECAYKELLEYILSRLPKELHPDFFIIVEYGGEGVPHRIKSKIKNVVSDILRRKDE